MFDTFSRYIPAYNFLSQISLKNTETNINLLEVGSNGPGFGDYNHFPNIVQTNIDIVPASEETKNIYPNINFKIYDGDRLPFEDNQFDIVICIAVLEHIPADKRYNFLNELIRVCKSNLIMNFPLKSSHFIEKLLSTITFKRIRFLQEHIEYVLPDKKDIYAWADNHEEAVLFDEIGDLNVFLWLPVKLFSSLQYRMIKRNPKRIFKSFSNYKKYFFKLFSIRPYYEQTFFIRKLNNEKK